MDYFAILVQPCTSAEAIAGLDNSKPVTPQRVREFLVEERVIDTLETYHTAATARALTTGQTIDSGEALVVSGTGFQTTQEYAAGYIANPTGQNTYIYVPMPGNVRRAVQWYSGPAATVAICEDATPGEMVHVEFGPNTTPVCTYWHDGQTAQLMQIGGSARNAPDINDSNPHKLEVEIQGDYVVAYVDDLPISMWYDPVVSDIYSTSAMYYSQIRNANDKIYGFEGYSGIGTKTLPFGVVDTVATQTAILHSGNRRSVNWNPDTRQYIALENAEVFKIDAWQGGGLQIKTAGAYPVSVRLTNQFNHNLDLIAATNATAQLWWQGVQYINIANSGKMTFPNKLSNSTVADATDAASVITQLNALLAILRTIGIINT